MKSYVNLAVCVALANASVGAPAIAGGPANVVAEQSRTVAEGRALQVLVAQSEIKTDINPSNIAVATGGGMLGGLLAASQNASRAKKAEAAIEPVRTALVGFDADALSLETTKAAAAQVSWLQPAAITFSKDSSLLGKSAMLDEGRTGQISFVEYSYDLSPDFTSIRVVAKVQFANKAAPAPTAKPEARLAPKNLAYAQSVTSVVSLPNAGDDLAANAAIWSADGGKAARAALALAFADTQALLPRTLALTAADIKTMAAKDKPKGNAGGFAGRVQEQAAGSTLLWTGSFVHALLLP